MHGRGHWRADATFTGAWLACCWNDHASGDVRLLWLAPATAERAAQLTLLTARHHYAFRSARHLSLLPGLLPLIGRRPVQELSETRWASAVGMDRDYLGYPAADPAQVVSQLAHYLS